MRNFTLPDNILKEAAVLNSDEQLEPTTSSLSSYFTHDNINIDKDDEEVIDLTDIVQENTPLDPLGAVVLRTINKGTMHFVNGHRDVNGYIINPADHKLSPKEIAARDNDIKHNVCDDTTTEFINEVNGKPNASAISTSMIDNLILLALNKNDK